MKSTIPYYSPAPASARPLQPSAAFKKEVAKVTGAIVLFFIVYLLLLTVSVGLAIVCVYLAVMVFSIISGSFALLLALGQTETAETS